MTDDPRPGHGPDRPLWGPRRGPGPDEALEAPPPPAPTVERPPAPPPAPTVAPTVEWPTAPPSAPPPVPPSTPTSGRQPPRGSLVPLVVGVVGLVVVLVVGVVAVRLLHPGDASGAVPASVTAPASVTPPAPEVSAAPPDVETPRAPSAAAACTSAPSQDAAGTAVTYDAGQVLDGRPDTAWRCDGDGVGQQIRIDLGRRTTLRSVAIVPGYAKTDPADGADRYAQNRRISRVRYSFDDGTAVEQELDTDPADRAAQTLTLPDVTTTSVTVTVLASVPGQQVGPYPPSDKVAISELQVPAA